MKAAFSFWNDRIAPVFDVARQVHLVEVDSGRIVQERNECLPDDLPPGRAVKLSELEIDTLVCGAISRPLHEMVTAYGIRVIPFVAGNLSEVIQAWLNSGLTGKAFAMPGCCGRGGRGFRAVKNIYQEEYLMNGRKHGGMGAGGGRGQGRGNRGLGRMGGPLAAGPVGNCVCPKCGYQEPHERGTPCTQKMCPQCGIAMSRQ